MAQQKADAAALPQHAIDSMNVLSLAASAISTALSTAQFAIAGFALFLTALALVGYKVMENRAVKKAVKRVERVAGQHLDNYIQGEHFKNRIDAAVEAGVQRRFAGAIIVQQTGPQPAAVAAAVPKEMAG